jgi:hypothetical protein
MDYHNIAERIIALQHADIALRNTLIQNGQLGAGYNEEMQELHNKNAQVLHDIIQIIGYPTIDKVGQEASDASWLVIQHAIGQPGFMRMCVSLLEDAVNEHRADAKQLAYLTDRIAVLEGKLQLYGTQFDWDENGYLSPNPIDDRVTVNERRKIFGLNTLEEQTEIMRRQVKKEKQTPPIALEKRKQDMEQWKKTVGWIV